MNKLNDIQKFIIFCLENYKTKNNLSGNDTSELFNTYNVFEYLEEGYEILHTQSMNYVVKEIEEFIKQRK